MSWQDFYLIAFLVGFALSAISFLATAVHLPHFHWDGHHGHAGHVGHANGVGKSHAIGPLNFGTASAFLAWFGGTGYLLERYSNVWAYLGLFIASISGLGGAALVFWFLVKLIQKDENLDPADYDMIGVLGRVTSPIRAGGTGELIYSRAGSRRSTPVRAEVDEEIPRDTEVVVTRYEKGIAYVRRWEEMSGEQY